MDVDAIDLKYARVVADYIGSEHTEVIISKRTCWRRCLAW
jgi:asparagine synthase (glutamine-hydrolysing)